MEEGVGDGERGFAIARDGADCTKDAAWEDEKMVSKASEWV